MTGRITNYTPHPLLPLRCFEKKRFLKYPLFCFVLFCFVLFCFVLFCFVLFCFFVLFSLLSSCFVLFCLVLSCFVLFCLVYSSFFRSFVRSIWLSGMACMIPALSPTQTTPSGVTLSPLYNYYIFLFVFLFLPPPHCLRLQPIPPPLDPKTLSLKNATHKTQYDWLSWL